MHKVERGQEHTSFSHEWCNPSGNNITEMKKEEKLNNVICNMSGADIELSDGLVQRVHKALRMKRETESKFWKANGREYEILVLGVCLCGIRMRIISH